jgi:hypothetical protein
MPWSLGGTGELNWFGKSLLKYGSVIMTRDRQSGWFGSLFRKKIIKIWTFRPLTFSKNQNTSI